MRILLSDGKELLMKPENLSFPSKRVPEEAAAHQTSSEQNAAAAGELQCRFISLEVSCSLTSVITIESVLQSNHDEIR